MNACLIRVIDLTVRVLEKPSCHDIPKVKSKNGGTSSKEWGASPKIQGKNLGPKE
jgi:hypothetical protein